MWTLKKSNGVNKNVVKNIRFKEYTDISFNKNMITYKMERIYSKLNRIGSYIYRLYLSRFTYVCKIYLLCFDDRIYILDDSIITSAYFQKDVRSR